MEYIQLALPRFERCTKCGQVIYDTPPDDPLGDAILGVLSQAGRRFVRMRLIQDFIGMQAGRTTIYERLTVFEDDGMVERDPEHPRIGWRITRLGLAREFTQHHHQMVSQ